MLSARLGALRVGVSPQWRSGLPYTVTTGRDENGDGLFTDRQAGATRNGSRGPAHVEIGARIAFTRAFGNRPPRERTAVPPNPAGGTAPAELAAMGARVRVEVYASAQNLTNRPNYATISGVMTSPFFGRPTAAVNPRRVEVGARLAF
jgi:hypothetical protein